MADQVIEQDPDGGEVLLDCGEGMPLLHFLHMTGNGEGGDSPQRELPGLTPPEQATGCQGVGLAGIGVSDLE